MTDIPQIAPPAGSEREVMLMRLGRRMLREPALLLSLAYISASALGLWASFWLYRPFGIPIFEYIQPSDILVAGLRDPAYLLLVLAGLASGAVMRWWERWRFDHPDRVHWLRRHWWGRFWMPRWRERLRRTVAGRILFGTAFFFYTAFFMLFLYTRDETEHLMRGQGQMVTVAYASSTQAVAEPAILIGTTAAWVFVYWPQQHRAEAIAQQSLRSLTYPGVTSAAAAKP